VASSTYNTVLSKAQAAIAALGLQDWNSRNVPVLLRKLPKNEEDLDSLPIIVVSPSEQPEKIKPIVFGANVWVEYPVEIVIIAGGNQDYSTHLDFYLSWRDSIRRLFQAPTLAGATSVFDTRMEPELVINRALVNQNYDYSAIRVWFISAESRN
jgi:hypothetical protein